MICEKCGTFNNDEAVFCTTCGADLKNQAPVAPAAPVQQPPYQQAPYQQAPYQQNPYQQNPYQQNPYQQNPYQSVPAAEESMPGKGLAIAGMILGIVSLLCFPYITGVLGIIFGAIAKSKGCTSGMATTGIILGAIGLGLWLIMLVACTATDTFFYMDLLEDLM